MHDVLKHMTSYYNRYYGGTTGALSAEWLHDHIAQVKNHYFPATYTCIDILLDHRVRSIRNAHFTRVLYTLFPAILNHRTL